MEFFIDFKKYKYLSKSSSLQWRCADGRVIPISKMDTKHLFNSLKMLFNHLAEENEMTTIWHTRTYADYLELAEKEPKHVANTFGRLAYQYYTRKDITPGYMAAFNFMLQQMVAKKDLFKAMVQKKRIKSNIKIVSARIVDVEAFTSRSLGRMLADILYKHHGDQIDHELDEMSQPYWEEQQ